MIQIITILVLICYLGLAYKFRKNNILLILLTVIAILILCNAKNIIEGQNSNNNSKLSNNNNSKLSNNNNNSKLSNNNSKSNSNNNKNSNNSPKGYNQQNFIVASGYQMGPYDGLVLTLDNPVSKYVKQNNVSLASKDELCVYQGSELPLKCNKTLHSGMGPSITGVEGDDQNLFMLYRNKSSPECCPSTFSTSTGCVCTTEEQRNYINSRGMVSGK